jgi:hypothetical protein
MENHLLKGGGVEHPLLDGPPENAWSRPRTGGGSAAAAAST